MFINNSVMEKALATNGRLLMTFAIFGNFLFRLLGIYPSGGLLSLIVTATTGAVILLYLVRVLKSA